eukprot:CAMPEP_0202002566 /NCGR_PEP_ID=MMETSP0905-20130828/8373_1 /ASSEMBLY_ACC=CAM_ASM_000554 /TAXON_ID=420261 /ORGANISM="Thalassiosira antarctica, Strain CCMP982" /LENGTH=60 /DNA_ID=CAMNT_0048559493 /DNA_START=257 /DNA_END=436 /DNA_ORIENTATION=+
MLVAQDLGVPIDILFGQHDTSLIVATVPAVAGVNKGDIIGIEIVVPHPNEDTDADADADA